jgi:hypothetical protein
VTEVNRSNVRSIPTNCAAHICNLIHIANKTELLQLYAQIKYSFLANKYDEWDRKRGSMNLLRLILYVNCQQQVVESALLRVVETEPWPQCSYLGGIQLHIAHIKLLQQQAGVDKNSN